MNRHAYCLSLMFLVSYVASAQESAIWLDVPRGNYSVGFKTIRLNDYSRYVKEKYDYKGERMQGNRSKVIDLAVWYPAHTNQTPMFYKDYIFALTRPELMDKGIDLKTRLVIQKNYVEHITANGADAKKVEDLLNARMVASWGSDAALEYFPLILFPSGAEFVSHIALAEFIASHGYIVMYVTPSRPSLDYVNDFSLAINYIWDKYNIDPDRSGAIGYSYGGMIALLLQMKNRNIDAVISYDGIEGWDNAVGALFRSPYFNIRDADVPYLRFNDPANPRQVRNLYDTLCYADITIVDINHYDHYQFLSSAILDQIIPNFHSAYDYGYQPANQKLNRAEAQKLIHLYTLNFLNAYVKKMPTALEFLKRDLTQNGFAGDIAAIVIKKGKKAPPKISQLESIKLLDNPAETLRNCFNGVMPSNPAEDWERESWINNLGYELLAENRIKAAIEIFELNTELNPNSWNVHDSLAEAYWKAGENEKAIKHYQKSVQLNPQNTNAKEALEKLVKR